MWTRTGMRNRNILKANELSAQKFERERRSAAARRRVDIDTRRSAEEQARRYQAAGQLQRNAATRMEQTYKADLGRSRTETIAARDSAKALLDPWHQAGTDALGKLQTKIDAGPGEFKESAGYQFRMKEGQKAVERSAAARGGALSGAALKDSLKFGQDFATNDYDNFLRRHYDSMKPLERMSSEGMKAAGTMGQYDTQAAKNMADYGYRSSGQMTNAMQYGANSSARSARDVANIYAKQEDEAAQRLYGYEAWKGGEAF